MRVAAKHLPSERLRGELGVAALLAAIRAGQPQCCRALVAAGVTLDPDSSVAPATPLQTAFMHGELAIARMLIEQGALTAVRTERHETLVHLAAATGLIEATEFALGLAGGGALDTHDARGATPLHVAAKTPHPVLLRWMAARLGTNIDVRGTNGDTPLTCAAGAAGLADPDPQLREAIEILLDAGADAGAANWKQRTALHGCALRDDAIAIRLLIARGAQPDPRDSVGQTPLALALVNAVYQNGRYLNAAEALIVAGANLDAADHRGNTPRFWARRYGHLARIEGLERSLVARRSLAQALARSA